MSQQHFTLPPSIIARQKEDEGPKKQTREEWKKQKELEELRKAGSAPAEVDETGKDINPHIPKYMVDVPWYANAGDMGPTLKHQRLHPEKLKNFDGIDKWYQRGVSSSCVTRYRKGACENCGSMTHKRKDCLERPRKLGARFTGKDIAPDEFLQQNLQLGFDGKRDRWNGVDVEWHQQKVQLEFKRLDEAKKILKSKKLEEDLLTAETPNPEKKEKDSDDESEDEDKYVDDMDMPGQKVDSKERMSVRNLRIREDTAKYLLNLDPNSAHYDPKSRSMRENPFKNTGKDPTQAPYAGDNFVRYTGDVQQMADLQSFAWEAYEKGVPVHAQADPTKLEMLRREYESRKGEFQEDTRKDIIDKYGGEEHLEAPPKALIYAQTVRRAARRQLTLAQEEYVEYDRRGKMIKGPEKAVVKSKYLEDVYSNNHTAVWGSFWRAGKWGFKCCHSTIKNSYCTGEAGKEAAANEVIVSDANPFERASRAREEQALVLRAEESRGKKKKKRKPSGSSSSDFDDEDVHGVDKKKLNKALKEQAKKEKHAEDMLALDERKRPYMSLRADDDDLRVPTEEEMEAFKMKKLRPDDPMAQFLGQK